MPVPRVRIPPSPPEYAGGDLTATGNAGTPSPGFDASRLVSVARVEDRLAAGEIVNALREAGVEAEWREPHSNWFDGLEQAWMGEQYGQILVLDSNAVRAREIVAGLREPVGDGEAEGSSV